MNLPESSKVRLNRTLKMFSEDAQVGDTETIQGMEVEKTGENEFKVTDPESGEKADVKISEDKMKVSDSKETSVMSVEDENGKVVPVTGESKAFSEVDARIEKLQSELNELKAAQVTNCGDEDRPVVTLSDLVGDCTPAQVANCGEDKTAKLLSGLEKVLNCGSSEVVEKVIANCGMTRSEIAHSIEEAKQVLNCGTGGKFVSESKLSELANQPEVVSLSDLVSDTVVNCGTEPEVVSLSDLLGGGESTPVASAKDEPEVKSLSDLLNESATKTEEAPKVVVDPADETGEKKTFSYTGNPSVSRPILNKLLAPRKLK